MALKKRVSVPGGFFCDYWKIIRIDINFLKNWTKVTMGLYGSKAKRDKSEDNFFQCHRFTLPVATSDLAEIYGLLKEKKEDPSGRELNKLAGATDVLE